MVVEWKNRWNNRMTDTCQSLAIKKGSIIITITITIIIAINMKELTSIFQQMPTIELAMFIFILVGLIIVLFSYAFWWVLTIKRWRKQKPSRF
jgi:uncharacterized membrane protein YhaH (DUF805 family)